MLLENNIKDAVVVGYLHNQIESELKGREVEIYHNPFFRATNSLGLLWFAKDFISDDEELLLINADVFWEQDILDICYLRKRMLFFWLIHQVHE